MVTSVARHAFIATCRNSDDGLFGGLDGDHSSSNLRNLFPLAGGMALRIHHVCSLDFTVPFNAMEKIPN
ncbi:MAG TPA: hypothetical protein VFC17_04920 [Candidatus Limnocylindrales bacterium]|nr:hypothetical protein [Candidatus Limnocylindrales bacterium]